MVFDKALSTGRYEGEGVRKVILKEGWSMIRVCVQGDMKDRV